MLLKLEFPFFYHTRICGETRKSHLLCLGYGTTSYFFRKKVFLNWALSLITKLV